MRNYIRAMEIFQIPYYADEKFVSEISNEYHLYSLNAIDWDWRSGVEKICIFPIEGDVVFKKAINGYLERDTNGSFIEKEYGEDFCLTEYKIFQRAKEENVDIFFAKVEKTEDDGIYKQERCRYVLSDMPYEQEKMYNTIKKRFEQKVKYDWHSSTAAVFEKNEISRITNRISDTVTLKALFVFYTIEELNILADFLEKYDINDLHHGNLGIFDDGTLKFFDYGGFLSSTKSKC